MNEQTKQFYTELQGRGVNMGTETDFETILGTNEGLEGVYNLSVDKGLLPQGFDKDTFKELLSLKEKPKMGKFGETVSQIGLSALEDSDEAKAALQKQAENDYEKKRIEKTKAGLTEEDKARIEEIDALKKQSGQANNTVTIGADGLFTVRTPEPMLGEYGLPTKVETPANPVSDSIERQIATKEAEQPSYIARGEDNMDSIILNAIERAQNTEEGQALLTTIKNKYKEEFKKSDEYLSLVKEFREGKKTEEEVTKALNDKYSSKIFGDFYKAISEKGGLMHEYIKDAEDKLKTKLAAEDAYSLSSEIKEAQENVNLRDLNKEYSEKYKKLYGINPDEDPLKGVRMKGLSAAKDFPKWQSYDLKLFAAEQFNAKALNMIEAVKNDSKLGRGFLDSITDIDTWDFGSNEVYRTSELLKIIEKVENDKELTKEESLLFDSALNYFATSAYYSDDLGRGYKAGQTTGASMPFMIQFLLSSGTTAAIEGALKGAASAATKKLVMGMIKAGKKKLARGLVVGGRMVGGALTSAFEAALMTGAFGIGKIEAGALNRQLGNVVTDFDSETNDLKYIERKNVQSKKDAYKNSIVDNYVEYLSEMVIANTFSPLGSYLSGTRMFKNIAKNDVAGTIVDIWNNPIWKSIRTTTKFGSLPEEVLEEELGGLLRWGLASDVNSKKEAGLDLDSQIDIVLGLAPTSIAFGGIGAASHYGGLAIGKKQFKNALNTEEEKRLFDRLMSESRSGKFGDLAHDLIRTIVLDKKMSQDEKKANISNIIGQYHDLLSKETQELADKVNTEGNEKLVDDYIYLARYGTSDNIYMTEDNKGLSIVIVDGEIGFNTIQVGRSYFQVADPSKSNGKVSVRYVLPNGGLSEVKEENVSNLTAPVITTPTQKFREYQLSWKKAENENQEAFEFNGGMYSTKTGRFINTKEKYEEDQQKKAENEEPSINTKPHHIDRELTVEINGEKRRVEIFSSNLTQNEEGAITGGRISITIDGNIATGERKKSAIRAISEVLKAEHIKAVQQYRDSHPSTEEQGGAVEETPLITDADRAAAEAEAQKEADRQNIIASFPKDKNGEVDIDKMSPEQFFVYDSDTDTPEAAMDTVVDVLNDLYQQLEENANETNREKRARNAAKMRNRIRQYEAVVVKYAGQETLDKINAARAEALQLNTPPVQEGAPVVAPVAAPVVAEQGETPPAAEPTVAPEQETPQGELPAEPDTTPLPLAEPVVEDGEVNEEEKEPMNLLDGQYAIVSSNSTRGKEQVVKVTQNEDGTETWTSIDDGKTVSQRAYKKQQFPEQDNMRVLGIKEGNEITPVIVLSGLADLSQAKGELKVVPVNTKDGKVHEAHVSLLYKQDADGGWSLLKGVGSRVLSPAEAAKYNSLDALLDFPIIPNVTVGNFTLRDMLEYPTLAKLKSRLEQLGIEYDKQTINTNLETALARWRELVRENNLNEEFKNNLDKLSPSTLATYKLYRAGVEPFTAGVPIADTMRTRSNINLYVQLDSINMLPNNISNPLAQLAVLAEVASDLGIIQKKAKGRYIDAIAGILEKTQKAVEANAEEFTGERKESKEDNATEEKQAEQPKAEKPKQQKPKAENKEETPAPAKPKTNIDSLREAFVEAYARTQNQAYNTLQKTMAKTAFKGMIDKMSEEDAVALYLNLGMESANSQGKMKEDMVNAAKALLESKHGDAINIGGAQQETNPSPVETTEETTGETEQTSEDAIDYEALVAERNELQETIYDMEDDEAANANARIAQINEMLRNRPEFMEGDRAIRITEEQIVGFRIVARALNRANVKWVETTQEEAKRVASENGRAELLKTPNAIVYGYALDGVIYITPEGMNANTPIHEYTHLWVKAMQKFNPQGWKSILSVLRKEEKLMNQVRLSLGENYKEYSEDYIASESLSRYVGTYGEERLLQEVRLSVSETPNMEDDIRAMTIVSRIKKALNEFWKWVGTNLFNIQHFESVEEIANQVLYDLFNETNLANPNKNSTFAAQKPLTPEELENGRKDFFRRMANGEFEDENGYSRSANFFHRFVNGQLVNSIQIEGNESIIEKIENEYGNNANSGTSNKGSSSIQRTEGPSDRDNAISERQREWNDGVDGLHEERTSNTSPNNQEVDRNIREIEAEREQIIAEAKANGTYMLAPNGKPTNLTEDMWVTVRTQAFKDWFGDWQNDPANASKVLDENSEPLVVYHGSKMAGFDEFQQLDESVNGFFTTDNKAGANTYATDREERRNNVMADEAQLNAEPHHGIYSLFANIKNPAIYDFAGKMYNEYGEPLGYYVEMSGEEWDNQPVPKFATEEEALAFARENGEPDSAVKTTYLSTDDLVEMAKAAGHDGVIFKNVLDGAEHNEEQPVMNDYIAFEPNQLKSATQNIGTFSSEDNRIEFMIGPATPSGTPADPMTFDAEAARRLVIKTQKYLSAVANPRVELPKEFEWWREVIATSVDRTEGIRWMMESINDFRRKNGMPELGEGFDVRTMVETMESKVMNETKSYIRNIENRLRDNIAKLAKRLEKTAFYEKYKTEQEKNQSGEYTELTPVQLIERYLIARDSIEREEMKGNPRGVAEFKLRMGVDMVTFVEEFHRHLFGTTSRKQELIELWESINAATNVTIERGWQSGLISLDEYEEYKKRKFYVPERDFAEVEANEDMAVDAPNYKRRGSSNKLIAMQQARGGQSLAANVLANICLLARDSILKANKNEVKKAMFDLLRANEDWCVQYHVPIPHQIWYQKNADGSITRMTDGPTAAQKKEMRRLKSLIRKAEDEIHTLTALKDNATVPSVIQQYENDIEDLEQQIEMLRDMFPYLDEYDTRNQIFLSDAAKSESTVIVWVDGVPTEMLFPNMSIVAKSLNGTYNKEGSSEGMKRVLSAVSSSMTVYNPAFFTVNVARDIPFIMTKGFAEYGMLFPIRFAAQLVKKAFTRDLWKIVWTGDASSISDKHLKAFYEGGANTGYTSTPDLKKLKDATKDWGESTTVTWSNIGDVISYMNTFSEVWTRAAAYSVVRNMGYNNEEGIKAAKNLSVNFNRKGLGNKFMNFFGNFSMFMNAAIQGSCGWYRTFKGNENTLAGKMWHATKAAMGFMLAPAFAGFINALLNPDDDDKMLWYSDYDRDNYMLFGDVRIPLNEQIKPFWVLGVNIALGMQGRRTKEQITNSMLSTIVTNLAPLPTVINESIMMAVNGATGAKDVGLVDALVNVITPQAIGGVYDLANGVNFMGSKLSYETGDKPQFVFGENETLTARMISEGLYYLGGGSDKVKSITRDNGKEILFDVNAREVDAVLSLIPSTYRDAVEFGLKFATGDEIVPEDFATVRRFNKPREEEITMARVLKEAKGVVKKNSELKSNMLSQAKGGALSGNTEMQNEAERRYEDAASNETLKDIEAYIKVYETVQLSKRAKKFGLNEEEFLNSLSEAEREILKEYDGDRKEYARKLLTLTREYQEIEVDDKSFEEVFGIE